MSLLLSILIFVSCSYAPDEPDALADFNINEDIVIWKNELLPANVAIGKSFTEEEVASIEEVVSRWESAADQTFVSEFYEIEDCQLDTISDYYYKDEHFGFHKAFIEVEGIDSNVLATCQLYLEYAGDLANLNFYNIKHADIIFNNFRFEFNDGGGDGKYDFQTVALHEFAHFIGLGDNSTDFMSGKMNTNDVEREIDVETQNLAYSRYNNYINSPTNQLDRAIASVDIKDEKKNLLVLWHILADGKRVTQVKKCY